MDLDGRKGEPPRPRRGWAGIALFLLVAVALAAVLFARRKEGERRGVTASPSERPQVQNDDETTEGSGRGEQPARVAVQAPVAPPSNGELPAATETPLAPPVQFGPVLVTGAAMRIDEAGIEHARDDGRLRMLWKRQGEVVQREVKILDGAFALDVPPDVVLRVTSLVLADVPMALDEDEFVIPPDRFLLLRGVGMRAVRLHAVAAESGSELTRVDVLRSTRFFVETKHPGTAPVGELVACDADSPVRLVPEPGDGGSKVTYFVRAAGRAWAPIAIDHAGGGERTLELARAGALEVRLVGNAPWLRPEVRLWPPEASSTEAYAHAKSTPDVDDRVRFEDLTPGTYRVTVERGWAEQRTSFGAALVVVPAGERTFTDIQLALPEAPVPAPVAGHLTLPQAWDEDGIRLVFRAHGSASVWNDRELVLPLAAMERDGETHGAARLAWSLELPVAGDYEFVVEPLTVRRLLHVPAGGLSGVEIDLPAPADVEVKVVDLANGAELFVERLYWSPPRVEEILTPLLQAPADLRSRRVSFRAPAGEIGIRPLGFQLVPEDEQALFAVHPGHNVVEYPVHRQVEVHFRFLDGEATVPWSWQWGIGAERVDGAARDVARGIDVLWFREEGTYELEAHGDLAPFEGFEEAVFPVHFPAPGDKPSVVDVRLRRR